MSFPEYEKALTDPFKDVQAVLDEFFHSGPSACFFKAPPEEEAILKRTVVDALTKNLVDGLSLKLELHPMQLVMCGSAHLGFSPSPEKLGRSFNSKTSDIDLAIIHSELFDLWWSEIREADQESMTQRSTVVENIFYGFIDPQFVKRATEIGRIWWDTFGKIETSRAKQFEGVCIGTIGPCSDTTVRQF